MSVVRHVAVAALTLATCTSPAAAVDFTGSYTDPKHPGCARNIEIMPATTNALVTGTDGTPGCTPGGPVKAWKLNGQIKGNDILVDFSPKGGPKDLQGVWVGDGIQWPDGNKWSLTTASSSS